MNYIYYILNRTMDSNNNNWDTIFNYDNIEDDIKNNKSSINFINYDEIDITTNNKSIFNDNHELNIENYDDDNDICDNCNIKMINITNILLECLKCGLQKNKTIVSKNKILHNYNVASSSFLSIKIVGKNSYYYQKNLLKTCSDYQKYSYNNNLREIKILLNKSNKSRLSKEIIEHGVDIYTKVKKNTFRGDSRKGLIAACLYIACAYNSVSKPVSYFCKIFNITERHFSRGYMIIVDLIEREEVNLKIKVDEIHDFLKRYLKLLNINMSYLDEIVKIINIAEKNNLHLICNSKNVTKCCGALMLLVSLDKKLCHVDQNLISDKCKISVNTFKKYYKLLLQYNKYYTYLLNKYNAIIVLDKKKYKIKFNNKSF